MGELFIAGTIKVKIARLLGVVFSDNHVTFVSSICSQRLYLIKLRSQGMTESKLHAICVALIVS